MPKRHRQPIGDRDYPPRRWWWSILYLLGLAILLGFAAAELLWIFVRFLAAK